MQHSFFSCFRSRLFSFFLLCFSSCITVGCAPELQNYSREFSCVSGPKPDVSPLPWRPRVALVLGGGGAKGMAHVGVLAALQHAGVPIDMVVGCSAGSIVGALYCVNPDPRVIRDELVRLRRSDLMEFSLYMHCHSLSYGGKLKSFLMKYLGNVHFAELETPLAVVATDLCSGDLVVFNRGPVAPAVHASSAFPFVYSPVKMYNHIYVDGGVINALPVDVAYEMGADLIIAVDIGSQLPPELPTNMFGVLRRCVEIQFMNQSNLRLEHADVVIKPDLAHIGIFAEGYNEESYCLGYQAAKNAIPAISARLGVKKTAGY